MEEVKKLLRENRMLRDKVINLTRIQEKVEELVEYTKNSLVITKIGDVGWEIRSYKDETLFESGAGKFIMKDTFESAINKAYRLMLKDKTKSEEA